MPKRRSSSWGSVIGNYNNGVASKDGLTIASGKVNFLRDTAEIKIYYDDPEQQSWLHMFDAGLLYATSENYENPTAV